MELTLMRVVLLLAAGVLGGIVVWALRRDTVTRRQRRADERVAWLATRREMVSNAARKKAKSQLTDTMSRRKSG